MQEVKIKCPTCGTLLSVKSAGDEPEATVTCPSCKATLRVKFNRQQQDATPAPPRRQPGDEGETVIGKSIAAKASFFLKVAGQSYQLSDGLNTIGRQASSSDATIQIATIDHKMSRHHAKIEVLRYPTGVVRVKISNWQNRNPTWVNGVELSNDETLILNNGCRLKMGNTNMTFVAESNM